MSAESNTPTADAGTAVGVKPQSSEAQLAHKNDPFTMTDDAHYVGHDGFVVPKDFEEFYQRFPDYIAKWVGRHAESSATKQDLEDWTNDLLVHLMRLPERSKYRQIGKTDVVQTFDPVRQYGANAARFWNYINLCLTNEFRTMRSKRTKDALCRPRVFSLRAQVEEEDLGSVGDEYCHSHSERLRESAKLAEKQTHDRTRVRQFENFVWRKAPKLLPVIRAIKATRNDNEAAALLEVTVTEFKRMDSRLIRLGRRFLNGEPVPKAYRTRASNTKRFSRRSGAKRH